MSDSPLYDFSYIGNDVKFKCIPFNLNAIV